MDKNNTPNDVPQDVIDCIARMLLPQIASFYESDEGKVFFEEWKKGNSDDKLK